MEEKKDICAYPSCKNELVHEKGKKKKKYCSHVHAVQDWQRRNSNPRKTKSIKVENWDELEERLKVIFVPNEQGKWEFKQSDGKVVRGDLEWDRLMTQNKPQEPQKDVPAGNDTKIQENGNSGAENSLKEEIPPMPIREKGEDAFSYADRKNQWKIKYNQ